MNTREKGVFAKEVINCDIFLSDEELSESSIGELVLGDIDSSIFSGDLFYQPLSNRITEFIKHFFMKQLNIL